MPHEEIVNVRYMVDDVDASIDFYSNLLGFELLSNAAPCRRGGRLKIPTVRVRLNFWCTSTTPRS